MKDCTTCKYGFVDEQFGFPMCHHPLRFSEDCVDFNMHEEIEEPKKATGIEEKKLPDDLEEAKEAYCNEHNDDCFDATGDTCPHIRKAFIAGAEWMKAKMSWHSVEESLPEMDEEVIVLMDEFNTAPIYKIGFGHIVDKNIAVDYDGWNTPGVKYWMPCPTIPNSE